MTGSRRAAVLMLTGPPAAHACPPGVAADAFALALAEDVADLLADMAGVDPAIAVAPGRAAQARQLSWPGTLILELPDSAGPVAALHAVAELGYDEAAVVTPDVPDLPGLLVAKPFSALATRTVAAAPDQRGGLAVLACRLPVPAWLTGSGVDLDSPDALATLKAAAPRRRDVMPTPGWHRLREPADLASLDPGLEGWEATRALLSGLSRRA